MSEFRDAGATVVAVSDSRGGIYNRGGLPIGDVLAHKYNTGSVVDFSEADWDEVMDLNLKSLFFLSKAFGRHALAAKREARVVNIASVLSFQGGIRVASYTASKHGVKHFGGSRSAGGRLKRPHQVTHDLHVAALYLRLLQADPRAANAWTLDLHLTTERKNQKLPDAVLKNPDGSDGRVIEFGGAYPARRVQAFHEDCLRRSLPYELW